MGPLSRGGIAGFAATVPMTAVMLGGHQLLPPREQYALPPKQIAMTLADKAGARDELSRDQRLSATALGHFGYGTATGAMYGVLCRQGLPPSVMSGAMWGLAVWAASYLGWLPAVHLHPSAAEEPMRRNAVMIAAHLVWGGVLGALVRKLDPGESR